jgi:two-component system CheB/CheR fusion protein
MKRTRPDKKKTPPAPTAAAGNFPVVGVGASAGGLEALGQLLGALPGDTGMAFVLILHLDPVHVSHLSEALGKATAMQVKEALDGARVEPNHVYVIPPNADLGMDHGHLVLTPRRDQEGKPHLPVDHFFRSLAADAGQHAVGVILSGTAWDGTQGLRAIKAQDGITLAQSPTSAKFEGMPLSAVESGVVDFVLPIAQLAQELIRLSRQDYLRGPGTPLPGGNHDGDVAEVRALLLKTCGVDFGEYKAPMFERRLARRVAVRHVDGLPAYLQLAATEPEELRLLCEDALIHVTSFFRDPEVFGHLGGDVLPDLLEAKPPGAPFRAWVAGCSSGEEVYSLAITLLEAMDASGSPRSIQIFASDLSEKSIEKARQGFYPESAMLGVSDERRRRHFSKTVDGYTIHKAVRDLCVFVRHDLARDPPFSRLDLVTCRNVLIYFNAALQKRVLRTFHYALNPGGLLLTGRSESISGFRSLFSSVNKADRIFTRSAATSTLRFAPRLEVHPLAAGEDKARRPVDLGRRLDGALLARYAPPLVLINDKLQVLQFRGETGPYLQVAPGEPQDNLLKMARGEMLIELRKTINRAREHMAPAHSGPVSLRGDGGGHTCTLSVVPFASIPGAAEQLFIVSFEPLQEPQGATGGAGTQARHGHAPSLARLEHELSSTKEYIQVLMEDHERADDDLAASNEELVSGNEELQSMNEELETAKEELQSTNEELTTVNDELQHRNEEVNLVNSDLVNLLETFDVPVLMLDRERRIRRFTPKARAILNVLPSDVGRPLDDIRLNINVPDLTQQVTEVIESNLMRESEVQDLKGAWYRMRIRPYKTTDNRIEGATLSMVDIDALKASLRAAQDARGDAERANTAKDQFLANLSHELRTPLSAMSLHAQMLRREEGSPTARRAGEAIERSAKLMARLIDDLLDVSRIVSGKLKLDLQAVDVSAVVRAVVDGVQAPLERKSLKLTTHTDAATGRVLGDPARLTQVVSNLVNNAIKFTPANGSITVTLATVQHDAVLTVEDSGMGIAPTFLAHVFSRFAQEDATTTRRHGGLGLGLAIARHLVEAHGGTISALSAGVGMGATFTVSLPLMALGWDEAGEHEDPSPDKAAAQRAHAPLKDVRVLVVDDDLVIREVLYDLLTSLGAHVAMAGSAAEAVHTMEMFHPQLLLCDIAMPAEDGHAFLRRLREAGPRGPGNIPAMALSAFASPEDRERALAAGFQMHLAKPVDVDRFTDAMVALSRQPPPLTLPSDEGNAPRREAAASQRSIEEN